MAKDRSGHTYSTTVGDKQHLYYVEKLWAEAEGLPAGECSLDQFDLDVNCWFKKDEEPTVRKVIDHCRKIAEVDMEFPIILDQNGKLMDGMHRVAKAYMDGQKTIKAVQFAATPAPHEIRDS